MIKTILRARSSMDRATDFGSVGWRFESSRARSVLGVTATELAEIRCQMPPLRPFGASTASRKATRDSGRWGKKLTFGLRTDARSGMLFVTKPCAPVAQLDRALASGAKGQAFESPRAYQPSKIISMAYRKRPKGRFLCCA